VLEVESCRKLVANVRFWPETIELFIPEIPMIKTQVLVKRKVGMTREAFADYWLGTHVAITAKISEIKRQTISIVRSDLQRADTPWDGLANAWWDDEAAIGSARRGDAFQAMIEDEANFVDVGDRRPLVVVEINPLAPKIPPEPHFDLIKIVNPLFKTRRAVLSGVQRLLARAARAAQQRDAQHECLHSESRASRLPQRPARLRRHRRELVQLHGGDPRAVAQ
jgi:uncharacterized protein (TIGR02118 family)